MPTTMPAPAQGPVQPGAGGLPGSRPGEPLPASADRLPVPTPDASDPALAQPASGPSTSPLDEPLPADADRFPTLTPNNLAASADSRPEALPPAAPPHQASAPVPQRGTPQPAQHDGQTTVAPPSPGHHASTTHVTNGDVSRGQDAVGRAEGSAEPSCGRDGLDP